MLQGKSPPSHLVNFVVETVCGDATVLIPTLEVGIISQVLKTFIT